MNKAFQVHMLNETGKAKAKVIAEAFDELLSKLTNNLFGFGSAEMTAPCPDGRELSFVKTKLEEACFFAKKAMASDPANCEQESQ